MRKVYPLIMWLIVGVGLTRPALGQAIQPISGQFADISFGQFVTDIEARTNYRFYYNPTETDSLRVRLQATDKTLPYLLSRIFDRTAFRFAIDSRNRVFITIDQAIRPELPIGFFERGRPPLQPIRPMLIMGPGRKKPASPLKQSCLRLGRGAARENRAMLPWRAMFATAVRVSRSLGWRC